MLLDNQDFIAEAAAIDLDEFTWQVFKRQTSLRTPDREYHQKHTLVLKQGDVYGTLRTRKSIQVVKADAPHILFRGIPESVYKRMMENSIVYKGPAITHELEAGFERARRVSTKTVEVKSKSRLEDYYKPNVKVVERSTINLEHYQWRKVTKQFRLVSKKTEKTKTVLAVGDIIGLRFATPSEGGYAIYDDDKRVMVSYQHFTDLLHHSKVVPLTQQRDGEVDLPSGKKLEKKPAAKPSIPGGTAARRKTDREVRVIPPIVEEPPIVPKYDLSDISETDVMLTSRRRNNAAKRVRNVVDKALVDLPDVPEVLQEEDEELFEDTPSVEEVTEQEDANGEVVDDEVFDGVDDDEESEEEEDYELADHLEPGVMFKIAHRTLVVVKAEIMERNENLMEYSLFDIKDEDEGDLTLFRLRLPSNYMASEFKKHATLLEEGYDSAKLAQLQNKAEYAEYKNLPIVK